MVVLKAATKVESMVGASVEETVVKLAARMVAMLVGGTAVRTVERKVLSTDEKMVAPLVEVTVAHSAAKTADAKVVMLAVNSAGPKDTCSADVSAE